MQFPPRIYFIFLLILNWTSNEETTTQRNNKTEQQNLKKAFDSDVCIIKY